MRYLFSKNILLGNLKLRVSPSRTTSIGRVRPRLVELGMMKKNGFDEEKHGIPSIVRPNPRCVDGLQQILHSASDSEDGWDKCWKQGVFPWDLGKPTPLLKHLHETGSLPNGTALIPGCGTGYDVVAIACPERYVIGMDISETALNRAVELSSSQPNASYFTFLKADFFTWNPTHLFDLIFDYTFFCAIEPNLRSTWAEKICDILKPDGELITLMFPIGNQVGGPPYNISVSDYEEVLHPIGLKATLIMDNELAVGPRKGREKIGRWKRCLRNSSL